MKSAQLRIHEQVFGEEGGRLSSAIQPSIGEIAVTPRPRGGATQNRRSERYRLSREGTPGFIK